MKQYDLYIYIGGKWPKPVANRWFDTSNPFANDVGYGLVAGYERRTRRALRLSERFRIGSVWVNTIGGGASPRPSGATSAGVGRESSLGSIKEFMQVKSVWIATRSEVANAFVMP